MKRALLVLALLLTPAAFGQTATPTSTPTPTATPTPTKTPTPPFPQTTQITGLSSTTVVGTDEFAVDKDVSGVRRTRKVTATQIGDFFDTTEVWDGIRVEDGDDTGSFTVMDEMDMDDSGDIGFARAAGPPDVLTATVRDEKVTEAKLKAVDSATDEECLTYETTTGDFEWQACGSGTNLPGGSDTQVQYNDGGSFGGDSGLAFNETTNALAVSGDIGAGGNITLGDGSGDSPGISFVPQTGDTFSILQVDSTDTLLFGVTSADVENVSINNLGAGTVNLALDGDFTATTLAGNLSCTNCVNETEVEDIYLLNSGDTSTGTISLGDGAGDSPGITFVPQTGDGFSILQEDAADTLLFGVNSADVENAAFTNLGAGTVNLTIDGDFTAANLSGAINLEAASTATGVADDEVPVGTAANTLTYKAVPDCDDSGGNHLNYDTGANAFSCGTSGDGGGGLPRDFVWPATALLQLEHSANSFADIGTTAGTNKDWFFYGFDATTVECVGQTFMVPTDVDTSGTVTFLVVWHSASATSGEVIWEIRSEGSGSSAAKDTALATTAATAATVDGTTSDRVYTSWTETVSTLGWAADDEVDFELCRNTAGDDDMAGDARLTSFRITVPLA